MFEKKLCSELDNNNPTNPFTILKLQHPSHDIAELQKVRLSPDPEALKLWKGSSGKNIKPTYTRWSTLIYYALE